MISDQKRLLAIPVGRNHNKKLLSVAIPQKSVPKVRKARAPFYFYLLEVSPKIMAESVDKKSSKQVLEIAQQQWATLTREEQERFTELAREDDQRYSQEKELKKGQPEVSSSVVADYWN